MTDMQELQRAAGLARGERRQAVRIDVEGLIRSVKGAGAVLNEVSFTVLPGELVAIVGGSGAGKTTLLEAMAGVTPATSGQVRFDGIDLYSNVGLFRTA